MSTELFSYDNRIIIVLLKRHHRTSPVIINGYYVMNGVASCVRWTLSDWIWLPWILDRPHTLCTNSRGEKLPEPRERRWSLPGHPWPKCCFVSLLSRLPSLQYVFSHAQWMKSGIASFTGADLSHVFKGTHSKRGFFFSALERGLGGSQGSQCGFAVPEKVEPTSHILQTPSRF